MLKRYFGEYTPWIEALCEADPAFPEFVVRSDRATRHFICAVLVYSELSLDDALDPEFATELRTVPRAKILANHIGEHTPGLAKAIGKLAGKPWTREQYHTLHVNMWNRERAAVLSHLRKIRPEHLETLRKIPCGFRRHGIVAAIKSSRDLSNLVSAATIITRVREDMKESDLARSLEQAISSKYRRKREEIPRMYLSDSFECIVSDWFEKLVGSVHFKALPWEGTNSIRPLRSGSEMRRCARHFENCLADHIVYAATGLAGYFEHVAEPSAIVQVQKIGHLGWAITSVRGLKNKSITAQDINQIEQEFLSAGFMPRMNADEYFF